jgi:hypothetical protein
VEEPLWWTATWHLLSIVTATVLFRLAATEWAVAPILKSEQQAAERA